MKRLLLAVAVLAAPAVAQRGAAPRTAVPRGPAPPEAAERYHEAARLYVDGQNAPALVAAEAAVALAPDDARAVALRDLIRQQQPPQNPPPDGGPQDDPPPPDAPPPDAPPENPDDGQPPGGQSPEAPDPPPGAGDMSRDQAERILDAVGGDERQLLRQMRRAPSRVRTNEEDW